MSELKMELRVDRDGDGDVDITVGDITAGLGVPVSLHLENHSVESQAYNAEDIEQLWTELTATGKTVTVGGVLRVLSHASDRVVLREGGRLDARIWVAWWNRAIHSSDWNIVELRGLDGASDNDEKYKILLETKEDVALLDGK